MSRRVTTIVGHLFYLGPKVNQNVIEARFSFLQGICADQNDNLYVCDTSICKIDLTTKTSTNITPNSISRDSNGNVIATIFREPTHTVYYQPLNCIFVSQMRTITKIKLPKTIYQQIISKLILAYRQLWRYSERRFNVRVLLQLISNEILKAGLPCNESEKAFKTHEKILQYVMKNVVLTKVTKQEFLEVLVP